MVKLVCSPQRRLKSLTAAAADADSTVLLCFHLCLLCSFEGGVLSHVTYIRIHVFMISSSHVVSLNERTCNLTFGRVRITIVAVENQ
jgi:hypothetical protein